MKPSASASKRLKGRIAFYGGIVLFACGFVLYATAMPGASYRGPPLPWSPEERALAASLEAHVRALAEAIGERRIGHGDSLDQAREYVSSTLRRAPGVREGQVRAEDVGPEGYHAKNVVLEVPGRQTTLVVVGAHYDSAIGAPGADDNATGAAAVLELARRFSARRLEKTIRFVLFANEEPPYFQREGMGSLTHARSARARGEGISAMLSLESLGYYSDAERSQQYPWPIGMLYPERGNFVAFVGDLGSRSLVRNSVGAFRAGVSFPSEAAALPARIPGVGWSDHWAFWESGYPALMVTDTAPYRNPRYHEATDRLAGIDCLKLARVTLGLEHVIERLATGD
jgi:hypothetical protein